MVINDVEIDMDERVWQQLLALPYRFEIDDEGHIVMTALQEPALTWEQLATTQPILPNDLCWKVETNERNQIIMSPPPYLDHADNSSEILVLLRRLLKNGRSMGETGVQTRQGTKIPDVVWVSTERRRRSRGQASFAQAPEICVEVISPSNTRREIAEKTSLYLEAGAQEVWHCERDGTMKFFDASGPLLASRLCPAFPARITILD